MKKKTFVLLLALVLIAGAAVGGTLAWLTATTDEVTNTFTTSDIKIELTESDELDLKMIPGWTITKDPKVTVKANSEDCYLFVKVEKSTNFDAYMEYAIDTGWTALTGVEGVYYREVNTSTTDQVFVVLKDDKVTVKGEVTKAMMNELTTDDYPTLTFTAYAVQLYKSNGVKFDVTEAWTNAQPTTTP